MFVAFFSFLCVRILVNDLSVFVVLKFFYPRLISASLDFGFHLKLLWHEIKENPLFTKVSWK